MPEGRARGAEMPSPEEMGLTPQDVAWRMAYLEFTDEDVQRLVKMNPQAQKYADQVIEAFYNHLLSFPETRSFFRDPRVLERVKRAQKQHFLELSEGRYDAEYIRSRVKIGVVHQRIGLPLKAYFGSYNMYVREVSRHLANEQGGMDRDTLATFMSLLKMIFLDINLAIESHVYLREQTIHEQQEIIRELSTPVLQVRDRLLIVPLVGMIGPHRARQLTEQLLNSIRTSRAKVVVMDITGVAVVDSAVANHLIQTVQASRLMGATAIVTGISSEVAQTLVRIGVDLSQLNTVGDLQEGIEAAERLLGYRVIKTEPALMDEDERDVGGGPEGEG